MEHAQKQVGKLAAFAILIVLLAGVPHFMLDRTPTSALPHDLAYHSFLPAKIGEFHMVNQWKNAQRNSIIEHGAIYRDPDGKRTAQIDVITGFSEGHNGLGCYLAHGIPLQLHRTERVNAADVIADFDVGIFTDQSLNGGARSILVVASTDCGPKGCHPTPLATNGALKLIWLRPALPPRDSNHPNGASLSIAFEIFTDPDKAQDQEQALLQFREFIANFKLTSLSDLAKS